MSLDGLLVVDKPVGPTSHDVVARVRRVLGERRVGHTGTLDPTATGVLPLVLGRATRLARFLSSATKTYEAVIRFGFATDTYDAEGRAVGAAVDGPMPSREAIDRALDPFRGTYLQEPPLFSAKKIAGTRSYLIARGQEGRERGQEGHPAFPPACPAHPARPARLALVPVTVHRLDLVSIDADRITVIIDCSAGFYVRSLAHELGQRLGIGAHLAALRRTRSGDVTIEDAIALGTVEQHRTAARSAVVPMANMLPALPVAVLTAGGVQRATHGIDLGPSDCVAVPVIDAAADAAAVRLLDSCGALIGIAEPARTPGLLHPAVILV
jgi:tRNA pseudouridine55 synthase